MPWNTPPSLPRTWDVKSDVVVGFGAAGMIAVVTAHELGAKVVILEKAPEGQEGCNTRVGPGVSEHVLGWLSDRLPHRLVRPLYRAGNHGEGLGERDVPQQ